MNFPIPFTKMSGAGNDFIIIDNRQNLISPDEMSEFARLVCRRKFSVGADGLVLIENSENADFKWQFFNGDGSIAEMCGNASRCVARFAHKHDIAGSELSFETLAGLIEARVQGSDVNVRMTDPFDFILRKQVEIDTKGWQYHFVNTGVPHVVLFVDDVSEVDVAKTGSMIRHHQQFMPAGTNVNFVQLQPDGVMKVRTYERGVEGETLACGTGCVAAALVGAALDVASSPVAVVPTGGDRLLIQFDLSEGPAAKNVFLQGPAHEIFEAELIADAIIE